MLPNGRGGQRFFCDETSCERRIFCERLPDIDAHARNQGESIAKDAPQATQVADRWHLLRGLALGLEEFLLRKRPALGKAAATETGEGEKPLPGSIDGDVSTLPVRLGRPYESVVGPAKRRHERLVERREENRRPHLAGASVGDVAEWVGTSQSTVYRYRRASVLAPYLPHVPSRWNEGCRSAKRLHREIREMGYRHSIEP